MSNTSKKKNRRATLKDVGKEAGFSVYTASVVLNGGDRADRIPDETRKRIRQAALKLKYRPAAGGRHLRHHRSQTIALFLSAESNRSYLPIDLLNAINDELVKHDYALHFARLDEASTADPEFIPRFLRQHEVDGVLVNYNLKMPQRFVDLIDYYEMPAVFLNTKHTDHAVYFNQRKMTMQVVERLAGLGHRRIYLVNFSQPFDHYSTDDTLAGYHDAMQMKGLEPFVLEERLPRSERVAACVEILSSRWQSLPAPTAVLAMHLSSAVPFVQAADRMGMQIPEQLSLVTTDGSNLPSRTTPAPSHIYLPWDKAGRTGVRWLLHLIEGRVGRSPQGDIDCEWREAGGTIAKVL